MAEKNSREISVRDLVLKINEWCAYFRSRRLLLWITCLSGIVLGFVYATIKKPEYTATTTFVLEDSNASGPLGQYAGLASMIGIDLGGGSNNGIFQGDNILELYKSRTMIQQTLLSEYVFNEKRELLIDRYISSNGLKNKWSGNPDLQNINFGKLKNKSFTRVQDSVIGEIVKEIAKNNLTVIKPDKKLSIINVKVKSKDELFAKAFNDLIVSNVNEFYVKTRTKKSLQNLRVLQHQTDSIRGELNRAIFGVAAATDANPNPNPSRLILKIPSQKKQIDAQANTAILTELVKNLELSKVSLRKETPLIQVIDGPVLPLLKTKPGKITMALGGGVLLTFLMMILLVVKKELKTIIE